MSPMSLMSLMSLAPPAGPGQPSEATPSRAIWAALTDEVTVRGTLSTLAEARVFADALGLDFPALPLRAWREAGHEQGQAYVDTGVCGCLLCTLFPTEATEAWDRLADEAIDREATVLHLGIDQPDWASDEYLSRTEECPSCFGPGPLAVYATGDANADRVCATCGADFLSTHTLVDGEGWLPKEA